MSAKAMFRLPAGGDIDRSRPLTFSFEGRSYQGFAGDTLASALLSNGVRLVGRSFKYHRPRGIFGAGEEECNALIQLGTGGRSTPNLRATEILLHDGMVANPVNCWPSLRFDIGGLNDRLSRFLAAGFYYKTFMWPSWHLYEAFIRKAAGLGRAARSADPDRYETRYAHCDVLVVGGGAAGLAAARSAAETGARVMLVEQDVRLGGQLLWEGGEIDGLPAAAWVEAQERALRALPDVQIVTRAVATGYFDPNALGIVETISGDDPAAPPERIRYRQWEVRANAVVLGTGAIERPLVFPGNDRPGVMLAGAVRHYIGRYAVLPGRRGVIFTNNDEAYRTAAAMQAAGGVVAAIVDTRRAIPPQARDGARALGIPLHGAATIVATKGRHALRSVTVRNEHGRHVAIACDLLAVSGGRNPNVHLFSQSGGQLRYDAVAAAFVPVVSVQNERSVGAAAGLAGLEDALRSGHAGGLAACGGERSSLAVPRATHAHEAATIEPCWTVDAPGKAFVDLLNDVTSEDVALAARENFVSVEHLKRYTTLGMGTDQGKTSNVNALAIMAQLRMQAPGESGTTRYRFPYVPTALGAFAGRARGDLFRVRPRLALHDRHVARGAVMEDYGWLRPAAYPVSGEGRPEACGREVRAVRQAVGIFDASPLGKIEVRGPDAARFLDFIYANRMSTLAVGKVRYGLVLSELGVIIDDGVCARLGDDHFLVGASSAGAERMAAWLEEWLQCEFVDHDVLVAPVTTSWSVVTLTGPAARSVLAALGTDIDLSPEAFPHMTMRTGKVAGVPARILRVSYTGETSYEINVPTASAEAVWERACEVGQGFGIEPIGIDAWNLLRLEKGYLHIGADTDGTSTPLHVGWDHVLKRADDFAGKRSLMLPVNRSTDIQQIVGLRSADGIMLPIGAHVVTSRDGRRASGGFVTSSGMSDTLGEPVAMAMIQRGRSRMGESVRLEHDGREFRAEICDPVRYDRKGERLNG